MISDEALGLAIERQIISAEQTPSLRELARQRDPALAEPQDEEKLSAGWRPLRAAILSALPASLSQRLPNPAFSS